MTQQAKTFTTQISKTTALNYLLHLPPGVEDGEKRPFILFLHGAGERAAKKWPNSCTKIIGVKTMKKPPSDQRNVEDIELSESLGLPVLRKEFFL